MFVLSGVDAVPAVSRPRGEAEPGVRGVRQALQLPQVSVVQTHFGGHGVLKGGRGTEKLLLHLLQLRERRDPETVVRGHEREDKLVRLRYTAFNNAPLLPPSERTET